MPPSTIGVVDAGRMDPVRVRGLVEVIRRTATSDATAAAGEATTGV